jgi:hypothetical protein
VERHPGVYQYGTVNSKIPFAQEFGRLRESAKTDDGRKLSRGNKTRKASSLASTLTWDAVSRSDSLTGGYNGTRGDEHGTIGYELHFFR